MIPDLDLRRIEHWAAERIPEAARDDIRIDLERSDRAVTIVEVRAEGVDGPADWSTRTPIARLRYTKTRAEWTLLWRDRRGDFHLYEPAQPTPHVSELLAELDADPTGIFWG